MSHSSKLLNLRSEAWEPPMYSQSEVRVAQDSGLAFEVGTVCGTQLPLTWGI